MADFSDKNPQPVEESTEQLSGADLTDEKLSSLKLTENNDFPIEEIHDYGRVPDYHTSVKDSKNSSTKIPRKQQELNESDKILAQKSSQTNSCRGKLCRKESLEIAVAISGRRPPKALFIQEKSMDVWLKDFRNILKEQEILLPEPFHFMTCAGNSISSKLEESLTVRTILNDPDQYQDESPASMDQINTPYVLIHPLKSKDGPIHRLSKCRILTCPEELHPFTLIKIIFVMFLLLLISLTVLMGSTYLFTRLLGSELGGTALSGGLTDVIKTTFLEPWIADFRNWDNSEEVADLKTRLDVLELEKIDTWREEMSQLRKRLEEVSKVQVLASEQWKKMAENAIPMKEEKY